MSLSRIMLQEVQEALQKGDQQSLEEIFTSFHPADIAETLEEMPVEEVVKIIRAMRGPLAVRVMEQLPVQDAGEVLTALGRKEMVGILEEIAPDDRADMVQAMTEDHPDLLEEILPMMAQAERTDLKRMISYEEDSAGSIMTTEYTWVFPDMTVKEAMTRVRQTAPDSETIYYAYVTDRDRKLLGLVSLRELLLAKENKPIRDIMNPNVISLNVFADQEDVANTIDKYDILALPIVDEFSRLIGIVTYDDALDVIREESTEDAQMIAGIQPLEEPYFDAGFWELIQKRGLWLCILFIGGGFTVVTLRHFEDAMEKATALIFFLPLVIASGGMAGSQSVTLITRGLAIGEFDLKDWSRVALRESGTGIALGTLLGLVGYGLAILLGIQEPGICLVLSLTLVAIVTCGTILGSMLPLLFKRIGLDPAIMSSPFLAALIDVLGIIIYFRIATWIIF